jgi:hypothetical protein
MVPQGREVRHTMLCRKTLVRILFLCPCGAEEYDCYVLLIFMAKAVAHVLPLETKERVVLWFGEKDSGPFHDISPYVELSNRADV